jgi:DNA-binding response OmpR family regulator
MSGASSSTRGRSGTRRATAHVLVAEDDDALREALRDLLEDCGYRVVCVRDGIEALAAMRTERPSVVILDLWMPNLDGFELRQRQLADWTIASVPVIAVTADVTAVLADVPTFVKPFETEDFLRLVEAHVLRDGEATVKRNGKR